MTIRVVKTIDSHIYDLKEDLANELSSETAQCIEKLVDEGIRLLAKEKIEMMMDNGIILVGNEFAEIYEKIAQQKDEHYMAIATALADIQKRLDADYPQFRTEFLKLLKIIQMNELDLEVFQTLVEGYIKVKHELSLTELVLKRNENETEEEHKELIKRYAGNGRDFLVKKSQLEDEMAANKQFLANAIFYYANSFSQIHAIARYVLNFCKQENDLDKTFDLIEAFYFPIEDRKISQPHKMRYVAHAIRLAEKRNVDDVSKWSYKVNEKLDEQEAKGKYDLDKAMLDAHNELFQMNYNYDLIIRPQ